jgi:prepilin-type N-terminal cleavage/methylation domain-containing protein
MRSKSKGSESGFTLIELMVALVVGLVLLTLAVVPVQRYVHHANMEQTARQTVSLMQIARRESIKRNLNANVVIDYASNTIYGYVDTNNNNVYEAGVESKFGIVPMPQQVAIWGAGDPSPKGVNAIDTWNSGNVCTPSCPLGGLVTFLPTGSAGQTGAVRFGDAQGNFLEVRVATAASSRLEIRKYDPTTMTYLLRYQNSKGWVWYPN